MKKIILLFYAVGCAIQLQASEVSEEQLSLEIRPEKDAFKAGDEVYLIYTIKNEGNTPAYILSGRTSYSLSFKDYLSGKIIENINPTAWSFMPDVVVMDSFILLKPGESYKYKNPNPIFIKQGTYGLYLLEFRWRTHPVSEYGFIIKGHFYGSDYPMNELKGLDEFKDIDHSVPLFRGSQIVSEIAIVFDGEYFRVKGEKRSPIIGSGQTGKKEKEKGSG